LNEQDVCRFLTKCKIAVQFRLLFNYKKIENKQTLLDLGYLEDDVIAEIMELDVTNYIKGPEEDEDGYGGDFWFFGKVIQNREIYIKLKIKNFDESGEKQLSCLCFSFHFAKYKLNILDSTK